MIPKLYPIGEGGSLRVCGTERFKAGMLSVSSVMPVDRESACLGPLLLSVLRRGTEKYRTLAEINRRLDYLWGTSFAIRSYYRGNYQVMGFSADLLDSSYLPDGSEELIDGVLELMEQILLHPILDEDGLLSEKYVESEKVLQCDAIRAVKNNPRVYAAERCKSILFAGEPCGFPPYGTEEQTMAVTREELTAFWKRWIEGLRLDCFYVGPMDASALREKLERVFPCHCAVEAVTDGLVKTRSGRGIRTEETLPVEQSQLVIGLRCPSRINDPDTAVYTVLNEMLGNSPISRLFVHVREKKSLCYSCSSAYNSYAGTFMIFCGLKRENRTAAEKEIFRQLRLLGKGKFAEAELIAAKKSLECAYRRLEDSPEALESFFYSRALMGNDWDPEQCRRAVDAVTREEIAKAAAMLEPDVVYFLEGTLGEGELEDEEN